ncbi:MAG: hypothetical protein IKT40_05560 [Bacilli bacterium]|jgi:hypothetical protein|nr:hypothetical protein [Bacilli bacterium]
MKFKIENTQVYGYERAIKASGNPMRTVIQTSDIDEKDIARAVKLGTTKQGAGHDNFLKGILVQLDVTAPLYWWKQAQRYHWFDFISSQSTMHCLLKFNIRKQCVEETDERVIKVLEELVAEYNALPEFDESKKAKWRTLVATLPCGFCLGATMTTNYQQLKTMYYQRRTHKLEEWKIFCAWCESLPGFTELTTVRK